MTAPTISDQAAARGASYAFLAALFDRPLDTAGLAALRAPRMLAALADAGVTLPSDFATAPADALRERLSVEFSHIFVAPVGKIMPHEGLMLAHEENLSGARADKVTAFMRQVGYRLPPESGMVADHLAVELAFAADLARREAAAEAQGDDDTASRARAIRRDFLARHLGLWAGIAARRITDRDAGEFYSELAGFMADLVAEDAGILSNNAIREAAE